MIHKISKSIITAGHIIIGFFILCILFYSIRFSIKTLWFLTTYSQTTGQVIGFEFPENIPLENEADPPTAPILKYTVNNTTYTNHSTHSYSTPQKHIMGENISLYYDPENPNTIFLLNTKKLGISFLYTLFSMSILVLLKRSWNKRFAFLQEHKS